MVLLAIYYDWTPLRRWIGRRVSAAWGTLNVTFDPANARQVRAARVLADVNWLDLLNFTPAATPRIRFERRRMQHRELVDRALVRSAALPAPREMKRPGRRIPAFAAPIAAVGVIAIVLGWWSMRVEWFPFTSMRMYADYNNSGVVEYYRVFQIDSAGVARPAHLEKMSRQAGVFHLTLWQAFANDRMQQRCVHLLQFCGREWNAKAPPSERVAAMEIRKYRWNFRRDRNDPNRGRVVDALAVSIAPAPSALKHTRGELVTLSDVATSNDLRLKNPPRCQLP